MLNGRLPECVITTEVHGAVSLLMLCVHINYLIHCFSTEFSTNFLEFVVK